MAPRRAHATPGAVFAGSSVVRYARHSVRPVHRLAAVATENRPADPRLAGTVFAGYPQRENFLLAAAWWSALQQRNSRPGIEFKSEGDLAAAIIPGGLFDSIADILIANALRKRAHAEAARNRPPTRHRRHPIPAGGRLQKMQVTPAPLRSATMIPCSWSRTL